MYGGFLTYVQHNILSRSIQEILIFVYIWQQGVHMSHWIVVVHNRHFKPMDKKLATVRTLNNSMHVVEQRRAEPKLPSIDDITDCTLLIAACRSKQATAYPPPEPPGRAHWSGRWFHQAVIATSLYRWQQRHCANHRSGTFGGFHCPRFQAHSHPASI